MKFANIHQFALFIESQKHKTNNGFLLVQAEDFL